MTDPNDPWADPASYEPWAEPQPFRFRWVPVVVLIGAVLVLAECVANAVVPWRLP